MPRTCSLLFESLRVRTAQLYTQTTQRTDIHLGWSARGGSMGAAMSDCSEFEDPGPPVTKERILRAIK